MPRYLQTLDIKSWSREGYLYYYHITHEFSLFSEIITVVTRPPFHVCAYLRSEFPNSFTCSGFDSMTLREGRRARDILFPLLGGVESESVSDEYVNARRREGEGSLLHATSLFFCCHFRCLGVPLSLTLLMPSWETPSNNDCLDRVTDLMSGTQWSTNISSSYNINIV